ncbi:MAG: hypothetical protein ACI8UO_003041 [Verrucomicrobiales bacterium]|jgi:hypothetical protein
MKIFTFTTLFLIPLGLAAEEPDQQLLEIDILGGTELETEIYTIDGFPPGLLKPDSGDDVLWARRLTVPVDVFLGDAIYGFGKFRFDTGFHPNLHDGSEIRADEYFVRFSPPGAPFQIQVGKFATAFGSWVTRHETDDDAFLQAPLAYNELTSVIDHRFFPGANAIAANRLKPNNISTWLPVIWDAAYIPGFALFGEVGDFNYAVEMKSRAVSSRPSVWDDWDFADPTWTGRLGYRPNAAWNFGASLSHGSYLKGDAGPDFDDFAQTTIGLDASYAHRHWQIWAEVIYSSFELPNIADDAAVWSYFIETRYKLAPQLFAAMRWNQQFHNELGGSVAWDNDLFRIDASLGYRFTPNTQVKLQYSWTHQDADFQNGENMVGLQVSTRLR